jgi:5-hydroxyisourate hydrolase
LLIADWVVEYLVELIRRQMFVDSTSSYVQVSKACSSMAERPFITCHVLDTVAGKPAKGIECTLEATHEGGRKTWLATTDNDGRVAAWKDESDTKLNEYVAERKSSAKEVDIIVFELAFNTGKYFGVENTFYPKVNITFTIKQDQEHYHLPLLLGPWSYTTYRGS